MASSNQKNSSRPDSSQLTFALIAVVVAICIMARPAADAVVTARRAAASINLGEIAKAYDAYVHAGNSVRMLTAQPGETAVTAAALLARNTQLNDATVWFVRSDPKLDGDSMPSAVIGADGNSSNPDFADKTLSYDVVANISLNPPPPNISTIPIAWTRGLRDDGTWAPDSPWGGEGGHIAFLDGRVLWFDKLSTQPGAESLYKFGTNIPTTNIREALPPGSVVLSAGAGDITP